MTAGAMSFMDLTGDEPAELCVTVTAETYRPRYFPASANAAKIRAQERMPL
jgi:hypothetical protein